MVDFLTGFGFLGLYFVLFIGMVLATRRFYGPKSEIFRKSLHIGAMFSLFVFLFAFKLWWHGVIACSVLSVLIYVALHFAEKYEWFDMLLVQRKPNEVKWNMILMFLTFGVVISVSRGIFNSNALAVASLFVWGFGDAAAALVGKKYGKHKLRAKLIEGTKSVEGTVAMAVTSFCICAIVLLFDRKIPWFISILAAIPVGIAGSVVELYTRNGADTITVPLSALLVLSGILWAAGGITPIWS